MFQPLFYLWHENIIWLHRAHPLIKVSGILLIQNFANIPGLPLIFFTLFDLKQ